MGKDFNDKFRDCIDKINNIAKSKGWKNGKDWAAFAVKFHLISESMKVDYDNCHELRNSMSHGNAKNIVVHQATYSTAREFLRIIEAKIRENKGNKKIRKFDNTINDRKRDERRMDRISRKTFLSDTEQKYLKDLVNEIKKHYDNWDDDIYEITKTLKKSDDPLYKNKKLFCALKDRLYSRIRKYSDYVAKQYYDLLNNFM